MDIIVPILLIILIIIRLIECYIFIKKVNKLCGQYDWKFVEINEEKVLDIIETDYYVTKEWSAYNFLFLKGPNPLSFFFSFKPLTLEAQYNKEVIEKLKEYEII